MLTRWPLRVAQPMQQPCHFQRYVGFAGAWIPGEGLMQRGRLMRHAQGCSRPVHRQQGGGFANVVLDVLQADQFRQHLGHA